MRSLSTLTLSTILSAAALPPAPSSASEQSRPDTDFDQLITQVDRALDLHQAPSFQELANAPDEAAVRQLYAVRGIRFSTEEEFIAKVQADWAVRCLQVVNAASVSREFTPSPPIEVKSDGVTYHIYGIIHTDPVREKYIERFEKMSDRGPIATEQNLGRFVGPRAKELADHVVITRNPESSAFGEFLFGFTQEGIFFFQLAEDVYPSTPELDDGGIMQSFRPMPRPGQTVDEIYAGIPVSALSTNSLPVNMTLDFKARNGINLDWVEARSAYMAEVLRRWTKAGEHRDIVCGAGHSEEIAYFLKHPCKDPFIVKLAEEHAAVLNRADAKAADGVQPLGGEQGYGGWFTAGHVTKSLTPSLILLGLALALNRVVNNYCRRCEEEELAAAERIRKQAEEANAAGAGDTAESSSAPSSESASEQRAEGSLPPPLPPAEPPQSGDAMNQ